MALSWLPGVALTVIPSIGGIAVTLKTFSQINSWYEKKLDKPSWGAPAKLHGPIRLSLYLGMGYASYLVYRDANDSNRNLALGLYGSQLVLNWLWTLVFFQYKKLGLASFQLFLLLAEVGACVWSFYPINKTASYLMIPYFAWLTFQSVFITSIWRRNKNRKHD